MEFEVDLLKWEERVHRRSLVHTLGLSLVQQLLDDFEILPLQIYLILTYLSSIQLILSHTQQFANILISRFPHFLWSHGRQQQSNKLNRPPTDLCIFAVEYYLLEFVNANQLLYVRVENVVFCDHFFPVREGFWEFLFFDVVIYPHEAFLEYCEFCLSQLGKLISFGKLLFEESLQVRCVEFRHYTDEKLLILFSQILILWRVD